MRTIYIAAVFALTSLILASCSAVTSPGRFSFDGEPMIAECPEADSSDLAIELRNFEEFDENQIEVQVISGSDLVLKARLDQIDDEGVSEAGIDSAALLCLRFSDLVETFPGLIVRTYVDLNEDFTYQGVDEPAWEDVVTDGVAVVDGSREITGIDPPNEPGGDFTFTIRGMAPHTAGTQHVALMVIDDEGVPRGFYRLADLNTDDLTVQLFGVLEPDTDYTIEFYADFIANGVYDAMNLADPVPMGDHAWLETATSDVDGNIDAAFDHNLDFDELSYF